MWQFIQIVTNVNTKVKIFLNVFVTLISKCDTIFKMSHFFSKCDTIFKSVTLFSNCDTIFKMSHYFQNVTLFFQNVTLFSKCHTWCIFLQVWHLSQNSEFCHTFFHFILARLDWVSQIDVTLYVHLSLVFSWADQRSVMLAILSTSSILGQFSVHPIGVLGLVVEQQEILMPL